MTVESLVARGWQEHLHPRDWRGWFITKGARVEIGGGLTGVVQEVNVGRAGDPASVRVKVRADNGRTGWVPTDRITVAQPPRGSVYLGDGSLARVGSPVMHTDEPGVDYVKKIAPDGGPVTVGKRGDDTSDREVDPTSLHGGSAPPPVRTPGAGPTARVAPAVRIKNALPHTNVNLDGIDPVFQNQIADAIIEVTNAFPLLKERGMLPSVRAMRLTGAQRTTRAMVDMTRGDMVFNLEHFKDTIRLGNPIGEEASGFTSARGISRARATTIHELGHSLHRAVEFKKGVRFVTAEQMDRESKRLVNDAAAASGVPSWSRLEIKDGLSTYGSTLPVETIAESFLEAFTEGPNARPIARSVTDQLLKRGGLDKTPLTVNRGGQRVSSPAPAPRQRFVAPRPPAPTPPPATTPRPTALPPAPTPTPDVPTANTPIAPGDRVTNTGNGITGTVRTVRPSGIVMYEDDEGRLRSGRIERFQRADAPGDAPTPAPTPDPTPAPPEAPTPPPAPEPDVPTPAPPAPAGDAPIGPGDRITVNGRTGTVRTVRPSGIVMYNDDEGRLRSARLDRVQRADQPNTPGPDAAPSPTPTPDMPTGYTPTGDMSNVEALTDEQLQAELDAAIAARRAVIEGGAPRTSIAYTDAHLKVNVFSAEQRRRNGATPPPAAEPTPAPPAATPTMDELLNMTRNEPRDAALRAMTTEQLTELRRETWAEVSRMNRQQRFGDRGRLTRANRLISAIQNETRGRREADTPPTDRPEFTPRNVLEHLGNENFGTDELARAFGVPQGQMLQMLRQLERGEYVARNNGNDGGDSVSGGRRTISTLGWEIASGRDGDHAEIMRRFDEANGDGTAPAPAPAPVPAPPTDTPAPPPSAPGGAPAVGDRINAPGGRSGVVTSVRTGTGVIMYRDDEGRLRSVRIDRATRADSPAAPPAATPAPAPTPTPPATPTPRAWSAGDRVRMPDGTTGEVMEVRPSGTIFVDTDSGAVRRYQPDELAPEDMPATQIPGEANEAFPGLPEGALPDPGTLRMPDPSEGDFLEYDFKMPNGMRGRARRFPDLHWEIIQDPAFPDGVSPDGNSGPPEFGPFQGPDINGASQKFYALRTDRLDGPYQAELTRQLSDMYNGPEGGLGQDGVRLVLDPVAIGFDRINIHGKILDKAGRNVGSVQRSIHIDRDGKPTEIHNDYMSIRPHVQGQGVASDLYKRQEEWARKNGIEKITIHANIDVGGYAWARKGYDYDGKRAATRHLDTMISKATRQNADPALISQLQQWAANARADKPPTPFEVSELGRTPGATTWPGKELMLGTDWMAIKYLQRDNGGAQNPKVTDGISAPGSTQQ